MGTKITQWIKLNLTLVICGVLAAVSIVLIALGVFLPEAQAKLSGDKSVYDGLQSIPGKAANERVVEHIRSEQTKIRRNVETFLASAARSTPRTLLHANVFPNYQERNNSRLFKDACDRKRPELISLLNAKDQPDELDKKDFEERIERALHRERREQGASPSAPSGPLRPLAMNRGPTVGAPGFGPRDGGPLGSTASTIPEGVTPEEWVKQDAHAGASVERCREIYAYANLDALDPRSRISEPYPSPEIMWEAQVSLWIQEDIIQVLARLNQEVADQLPDEERYVANLPVKHLLYIALGDRLTSSDEGAGMSMGRRQGGPTGLAGSIESPEPPASTPSFTAREVGESLDVIHLAVGLVIDANYLLRVIDEIGKSGFYTPLLVSYEAVPYDENLRGYIYGPAPVIRVRLEFEHCILRDKLMIGDKKYVELMPEAIKSGTWTSPTQTGGGYSPTPRFGPTRGAGGSGGRFGNDF